MQIGPIDSDLLKGQLVQGLRVGVIVSVPLSHAHHGYLGVDLFQISGARRGSAPMMADLKDRATHAEPRC